jgi:hypothetical protein
MPTAALLSLVLTCVPEDPATHAARLVRAWSRRADGAAVATQVVVHEGEAESAANAEPCALAWDPQGPRLALRKGGLTVALSERRLQAAHAEGVSVIDQDTGSQPLAAWRATFAEMPWPQPAMLLLPADRWPADMDPEAGSLVVEAASVEGPEQVIRLRGERGSWMLRFRGEDHPRLVEAVRRIDAGPRVPAAAWIEWRMRFEHAEPESGIFSPPIEGRPRVGRLEAVMPTPPVKPPRRATRPGEHEVEATPEQRGDSIPPTP